MKLKPLLPSLREKKRYVAFKVESKDSVMLKDAMIAIETSMQKFLGDLGMAKIGLIFLKDWKNNTGIMRVNTKYVDHAKASLTLVQKINNKKAIVRSIKVSGALDKIRSSYF